MLSERYRNRAKSPPLLRFNLVAGIYNLQLSKNDL